MKKSELEIHQLKYIIDNYPNIKLDIEGVIVDYIGKTSVSLDEIFREKFQIYDDLYLKPSKIKGGVTLLRAICSDIKDAKELAEKCKNRFPKITQILQSDEFTSKENSEYREDRLPAEDGFLDFFGNEESIKIWQLSDIHFGKLNTIEPDPYELSSTLSNFAYNYEKVSPDIILISGDLTSKAENAEFSQFINFAETLSKEIWGEYKPQRFIVVPGNHDTYWNDNYTSDRLRKFQEIISSRNDLLITPFGDERKKFEEDNIIVNRFYPRHDRIPPFAIVEYHNYKISIILLTSSYYSGNVPESVRTVFENISDLDVKNCLEEILRIDKGSFSKEFLSHINKNLVLDKEFTNIAITHHNLRHYGSHECTNKHAQHILKMLYDKGCYFVLHGHVHLVENKKHESEAINSNHAIPIPCSSLSSHCFAGAKNSFNIHIIKNSDAKKTMNTYYCPINLNELFEPMDITSYYYFDDTSDIDCNKNNYLLL